MSWSCTSSGWPRSIWVRPCWRRACGCRTSPDPAGGCRRSAASPPPPRELFALADWLRHWGVTRVVMESTGDYWKGPFWLLEAAGFECWLVNARDVKNVPGRPKTDKHDAVWLAKVAERGMCRPSLVQPRPIRELRDLTRYRRSLIRERTREMQRVEKLLEDAQIKLSSVISDIFGVSGREMLEALIGGQRDPQVLARMARARMRAKITVLQEALSGVLHRSPRLDSARYSVLVPDCFCPHPSDRQPPTRIDETIRHLTRHGSAPSLAPSPADGHPPGGTTDLRRLAPVAARPMVRLEILGGREHGVRPRGRRRDSHAPG